MYGLAMVAGFVLNAYLYGRTLFTRDRASHTSAASIQPTDAKTTEAEHDTLFISCGGFL